MDSVAKRTRSRHDQMYKKLHEGIKIKNLGSAFTGFRDHIKPSKFHKQNQHTEFNDEDSVEVFGLISSDDDEIEVLDSGGFNKKKKNNTVQKFDLVSSKQRSSNDDSVEAFCLISSDDEIKVLDSADFVKKKRKNTVEKNVGIVCKRKRFTSVSESDQSKSHNNDNCSESILDEEEGIRIPLKYTFGTDESPAVVVQKSEEDKELDLIWDDMNLYLSASDHDPPDTNIDGEIEDKEAGNCIHGGEHFFLLDEEIGLKCKFCSFVSLEIKYYIEPFFKNPFGRGGKQRCYPNQVNIFDGLDQQELDDGTQQGYNLSSHVEGTVWEIIPGIRKDLHTHQREGFLFLWKNIGGGIDLEKLKQPTGFNSTGGCIISHAPGTGKTRLAIVFLQTYTELYPKCRPIVIAPCSMLNSWEDEFRKWKVKIPFHNLNKSSSKRFDKLMSWKRKTSVLGLSYRLFEELVRQDKKNCKGRHKAEDVLVRKILLQFPGLIVLDEGHNPRNDNTLILQALSRIETKKRIILSGTPFQNDFKELFNTLCLARPQFPDSLLKGFRPKCYNHDQMIDAARREWKRITSPIYEENSNGRMKAMSLKNVRDMISPFVHLYKGDILHKTLPGLREAVINLKPDEFQKGCLDRLEAKKDLFGLNLEIGVSLVSVHPCLMPKELVEKGESGKLRGLRLNPDAGVKTKFVIQLIRRSVSLKEKVLVFSQFRGPLNLISEQLVAGLNWTVEREILEINGTVNQDERQSRIKCYNDPKSEAKVMLATTRTCSEGINFVGASRVILVDVVWNPQVERQAISRAYRLGQTKVVYIYHLITCGTMEEEKYSRQTKKGVMSDLVFNSWESGEQSCSSSSTSLSDDKKDRILEAMLDSNKLKDAVDSIMYQPRD